MSFTRTSEAEAECVSRRGITYRLLAPDPDGSGTWMIIPAVEPAQPAYYAVPGVPGVLGYEIRRAREGEAIGHAENLGDAAWPVEEDLIRQRLL